MTSHTRSAVESLARSWDDLPEGSVAAPTYRVTFTPRALLALMDLMGTSVLEADLVAGPAVLTAVDMVPDHAGDASLTAAVARGQQVVADRPTGTRRAGDAAR